MGRAGLPLEAPGAGSCLSFPSSGGSRSTLIGDGITPSLPLLSHGLHLYVYVSNLPLIRTCVIMELRVILILYDLILTNASAKVLFPYKATSTGTGA